MEEKILYSKPFHQRKNTTPRDVNIVKPFTISQIRKLSTINTKQSKEGTRKINYAFAQNSARSAVSSDTFGSQQNSATQQEEANDGNLMVNSQKYLSPYTFVASIGGNNNGNFQYSSEQKIDNSILINEASSKQAVNTPKHPKDSYLQSLENSWNQFQRRQQQP